MARPHSLQEVDPTPAKLRKDQREKIREIILSVNKDAQKSLILVKEYAKEQRTIIDVELKDNKICVTCKSDDDMVNTYHFSLSTIIKLQSPRLA